MARDRGLQTYTVQEALNVELGQGGTEYVATGSTVNTDCYVKILSLHAATTVTATGLSSKWADLTTVALEKGATITGSYSSVTIGGGSASALVYKG